MLTYLFSSVRNLTRNAFYGGLAIAGLAVSFAAVILIIVFVHDELTYDRFIPGYQSVYRLEATLTAPGGRQTRYDLTPAAAAGYFGLDFPMVQDIVRITPSPSMLRRDQLAASDRVLWADESLFSVLPLKTIQGDVAATLAHPDGVVLTRTTARKYFGDGPAMNRTLEINPGLDNLPGLNAEEAAALGGFHLMRVGAVIEDLPTSTHLEAEIFASAKASFSPMKRWDKVDSAEVFTYLRLRPSASGASVAAGLDAFGHRHFPPVEGRPQSGWKFRLTPLADIHLSPAGTGAMKPSGDRAANAAIAAIGVLLACVAAINFITLATARASRRAVEVGVRKTVGASRWQLIAQFMVEALVNVVLALIIAAVLAQLASPYSGAILQRALHVSYVADPTLLLALLGTALGVATLAGFYPALILSAFRPAAVLNGGSVQASGSAWARQALVVFQFAVLIGLIIVAGTISRQTTFALKDSLRLDTRQVVTLFAPCSEAFLDELKSLHGVKSAACTSGPALNRRPFPLEVGLVNGGRATAQGAPVGPGFFELQGLQPLAGRFFSESQGQDIALMRPDAAPVTQPTVVLNEAAVRRLGFPAPKDAVGRAVSWSRRTPGASAGRFEPLRPSTVIGVVRDYSLGSVRTAVEPTYFYVDPKYLLFVAVKLEPEKVSDTLTAIDQLWTRTGHQTRLQRSFEDSVIAELYRDVSTQAMVMAICAGLAILIACLGLFALSAFSTERRTKEIGIRKALGATTSDIVRLLFWSFIKPVLVANIIAWPLAWWAMKHWLEGFAYHVDLPLWLFAEAGAMAILVAMLTVSAHSFVVARARPVNALRYE